MLNAVTLLIGIAGGGMLKGFASKFVPEGQSRDWFQKLYGVAAIIVGAALNMKGKRAEVKSIGTGMVVFGLYDALVSNVPQLQKYLPSISIPTGFLPGSESVEGNYRNYGQSVYDTSMMGSNLSAGGVEIVGSSLSSQGSEIVGMNEDYDLADALDMAA